MTATGHALIGTALAVSISNPVIGVPLAILSHIAADAFPHWDTGWKMKEKPFLRFFAESVFDLLLSLTLPFVIVYLFFPETSYVYTFIMVISAQLFDWLTAPYIFLKWKFFPFDLPYKFQKLFDNPIGPPWGVIGQVAVIVILFIFAWSVTHTGIQTNSEEPVPCTLEAKVCPDGSSVGREGPNCEFTSCPE